MSMREYNRYIDEILPGLRKVSVFDKECNISLLIVQTLNRLQSLFRYENLPSTLPAKYLEMYLQMNGNCCIADVDGSLYALVGSLAAEPDAYYLPTKYVVANPYLNLSKTYTRDVDCIVLMNDPFMLGLLPIIHKYAAQMAENELSMNMSVINARIMSVITASTDREKQAADKFIYDIIDGKLSSVGEDAFFEGIKVQPYANSAQSNALTDLIEMEQYLRAGLFNDLGLNANYNMKRESINSNESQLNDDMLSPFIDVMLKTRQEGIKAVNDMFGTDIKVDFASAWKENKVEHDIELLNMLESVTGGESVTEETTEEVTEETPDEVTEETPEETPEEATEEITEETTEDDTESENVIDEIKSEIAEGLQELIEEETKTDEEQEVVNNDGINTDER